MVITRRNDYSLTTQDGSPVRNGQRWRIEQIGAGEVTLRSCDDDQQGVVVPREYLANHGQLGYATTGHSSHGVTVDSSRVVMNVGQADRAAVYVPMIRGRDNNSLYLVERAPVAPRPGMDTTPPQSSAGNRPSTRRIFSRQPASVTGRMPPRTRCGRPPAGSGVWSGCRRTRAQGQIRLLAPGWPR